MESMTNLHDGFDDLKPSLFELLSEQQLSALLPPSLRYLLALLTHRHPRYLIRALNSFDELYAVLSLFLERYFLRTYGGGFTENFYGLKRERVLRTRNGEIPRAQLAAPSIVRETLKLRNADVWRNLAVMVGVPYLKRKLDESYDIHAPQAALLMGPNYRRRDDVLPPDAGLRQRFMFYYKWFLRHVYPSINCAYYLSLLAFNLAYLFDGTKFASPFLWLVGTRIRRLNEADHRAIALATNPPPPSSATSSTTPGQHPTLTRSLFHPSTLSAAITPRLLSSLRILLPTSIFALKFLEWWHASDFARQLSRKAAEGLELPPPVLSGLSSGPEKPTTTTPATASKQNPTSTAKETSSHDIDPTKPTTTTTASSPKKKLKPKPPISSLTHLPIFTVPATSPPSYPSSHPQHDDPSTTPNVPEHPLCPICQQPIETPTAAQTGHVYCYSCIHRWVEGTHERQVAFMAGGHASSVEAPLPPQETTPWADEGRRGSGDDDSDDDDGEEEEENDEGPDRRGKTSREGRWESGIGRDAVTGRRVLGGTEGLRRLMV